MSVDEQVLYLRKVDGEEIKVPLRQEGEVLSLAFVEIGCKPSGKSAQLRNRRMDFHSLWNFIYRDLPWVGFTPEVFRIAAHYDPNFHRFAQSDFESYDPSPPDAVVQYTDVPQELLEEMDGRDKAEIFRIVHGPAQKRALLEGILRHNDSQELYRLITRDADVLNWGPLSLLRGKMGEAAAHKDIDLLLSRNGLSKVMKLYRNVGYNVLENHFDPECEVDGIIAFYGVDHFYTLLDKLAGLGHANVYRLGQDYPTSELMRQPDTRNS